MRPTLNINGIQSANVGAMAGNIIPTKAEAVLDLRLVRGNDVTRQIGRVTDHIRAQGYQVIDHEPTDAERQQFPKLIRISRAMGTMRSEHPWICPLPRKSLPPCKPPAPIQLSYRLRREGVCRCICSRKFKGQRVSVPVVNYDNNQHAENENVNVQYLWDGIEIMAAIMRMK